MNSTLAAFLAILVIFAAGLGVGHHWGASDQADTVARLSRDLGERTGERDAARGLANANAGQLTALRDTLALEREHREQLRAAAAAELGKRADRIAALERGAEKFKQTLTEKAAADEDCAALRDLPVCAAVAERLWGAATADPH